MVIVVALLLIFFEKNTILCAVTIVATQITSFGREVDENNLIYGLDFFRKYALFPFASCLWFSLIAFVITFMDLFPVGP